MQVTIHQLTKTI